MRFRLLLFFILITVKSIGASLDSLEQALVQASEDTSRLNLLSELCHEYRGKDIEKSILFARQGVELARKLDQPFRLQHQLNNLGVSYAYKGLFDESIELFTEAFEINKSNKDSTGMATGHNNLGLVHYYKGNYEKAISHYTKSVEIREMYGQEQDKAASLNNIGLIYEALKQYEKALQYHNKALEIRKATSSEQIGTSLANIGNIYFLQDKDTLALKYFLKAHQEFEKYNQNNDLALLNSNIALIYEEREDYTKAILYYIRGLETNKTLKDYRGIGVTCSNLAGLYYKTGEYEEALKYANQALSTTKYTGSLGIQKTVYAVLHKVYQAQNNHEKAYEYQSKLMAVKDSLLDEKSLDRIKAIEKEFESRQESIIKEADVMEEKLEKISSQDKKLKLFGAVGLAFILILFSLILYNVYRVKNESLEKVQEQNSLLADQSKKIDRQNQDLKEALSYAKKIQEAILPTEQEIREHFSDAFVLFKPKNKVGGDFYWFSKIKNYKVISVLDCTGHGIAGGYMAMLGNDLLSQIINDDKVNNTGQALTLMNLKLATAFSRVSSHDLQLDGMEVALLTIDEDTNELEYAGAYRHLYLVRGGELQVIKGESHMIGVQKGLRPEFHSTKIKLQKGDAIYLHTDGYANQFGGDKGKKFKYKNLQKLLTDSYSKNLSEQKEILLKSHLDWVGDGEQLDDICIVGIRI